MTLPTFTKEAPPSLFEDLFEIFYAPRKVFERRRETPAFGLALLVFLLIFVGLAIVFKDLSEPVMDAEFKRGMAKAMRENPQLTMEQMAAGKAFVAKFQVLLVAGYSLLAPLLLGLVLWLVAKVVESKASLGQAMMVATYAMFPRVLESILGAVQLLLLPDSAITSRYSTSFGIGRFLDPATTSDFVLGALGRVDVFTLWVTALLAIGIGVMGKLTAGRAAAVGAMMWLVGLAPLLPGLLQGG